MSPPDGAAPIAVVIVNFNGDPHVLDALAALRAQTSAPAEVIVVDNASTDGSAELIERTYPEVQLHRLARNTGFGVGANYGVRLATTSHVAVLNSDCTPEPAWLDQLTRAVRTSEPSVWAWGSVLLQPHGAVESAGDEYASEGYAWKRWKGRSPLDLPEEPYETFGPAGAAPVFVRSIFERLGGYDERFFLYYEDVDLSARARLAGFRALTVPTARTRHILGASGDEATLWFHVARNRPWVAVRVLPKPTPRLLAHVFADEIRHARSYDHLVPTVRGLVASIAGLPAAVLARRRLQRTASATSTLGTALLGSADCPP